MSGTIIRRPVLFALALIASLVALRLTLHDAAPAQGEGSFSLRAPSFVSVVSAQEASQSTPTAFPQDEAGISAYFKSDTPITLASVRSIYRVVEVETGDYIIGSVPVPEYQERHDVHVYIHRDGWFLAYYLASDPVAKIVDWRRYTGTDIPTKLDNVLAIAAVAGGVAFKGATYYDFRYPNATNLMLIAEDHLNGGDFSVDLPGDFTYFARSWSLSGIGGGHCGSALDLDGTRVGSVANCEDGVVEGDLSAAQLLPDTYHTLTVSPDWQPANAALVLVYRVP
jgi:hypothetical protein